LGELGKVIVQISIAVFRALSKNFLGKDGSLPYLRGGCLQLDRQPALRPQYGPSVQPLQTSRLIEPLRNFSKLQDEKPVDISKRIQRESVISENVLSQKH